MGREARTKGHGFERLVARVMRNVFPEAARGFQTRFGSSEEPDVIGTPFIVECKKGKSYASFPAAMRQAVKYKVKKGDARPCVTIIAKDRKEPVVTILLSEEDSGKFWMDDSLFQIETRRTRYPRIPTILDGIVTNHRIPCVHTVCTGSGFECRSMYFKDFLALCERYYKDLKDG